MLLHNKESIKTIVITILLTIIFTAPAVFIVGLRFQDNINKQVNSQVMEQVQSIKK